MIAERGERLWTGKTVSTIAFFDGRTNLLVCGPRGIRH